MARRITETARGPVDELPPELGVFRVEDWPVDEAGPYWDELAESYGPERARLLLAGARQSDARRTWADERGISRREMRAMRRR